MQSLVFVALAGSRRIAAAVLDNECGRLSQAGMVPLEFSPRALVAGTHNRVLYAAGNRQGQGRLVSLSYSFEHGRVGFERLGSVSVPGIEPATLTIDPSGNYLVAPWYVSGCVTVHRIEDDGSLGAAPTELRETEPHAHDAVFAPGGARLVVPHTCPADSLHAFSFDAANGRLTPEASVLPGVPPASGPRDLAYHPDLPVLYVLGEQGGHVTAHWYDSETFALRHIRTVGLRSGGDSGETAAARLILAADGKSLYASDRGGGAIVGFCLDEAGAPKRFGRWSCEPNVRAVGLDASGGFLLCAGQQSNHLSAYRIDSVTGELVLTDRKKLFGVWPWHVPYDEVLGRVIGSRPWAMSVVPLRT